MKKYHIVLYREGIFVKTKAEFRKLCLDAMGLMQSDPIYDIHEGHMQQEGKYVYRQNGFSDVIGNIQELIFDTNPEIENNYSETKMQNKIEWFLYNLFLNPSAKRDVEIDEFHEILKQDIEKEMTTFIIPQLIEFLIFDEEISIGDISFQPYSEQRYLNYLLSCGVKRDKVKLYPEHEMRNVKSFGTYKVRVCDFEKAYEKAEHKLEEMLNVLRLYNRYHNFGIKDKFLHPRQENVHIINADMPGLSFTGTFKYRTGNWKISSTEITSFRVKLGLSNIETILKKEESERLDMENKLLRSIQWYGETAKYKYRDENLPLLFTALESILIKNRNEEKKKNLSERCAILYTSDIELRKRIMLTVENLYSARNRLIHDGISDYDYIEFQRFERIIQRVIIVITQNILEYSSFDDWANMIDTAKLSSKLPIQ